MESANYLNRTHELNPYILDEVQPYLAKDVFDILPMAREGLSASRIRILEPQKLVIRIARDEEQKNDLMLRLDNMKTAREIIATNNFEQLKVPKASLTGNYMVEKLLPVHDGLFSTMIYYINNHQFFDSAVSEFIKFLNLTNLKDILGGMQWTPSNWSKHMPRYDNIKIYEKNKNDITKYQIGLIDLERFESLPKAKNHLFKIAKKVIYLFPYQFNVVLTTCEKIKSFDEISIKALKQCQEEAFESIRESYQKHHEFFHSKSLLISDPVTRFINSPEEQTKLIEQMAKELFKIHLTTPSTWYLIETKNMSLTKFKPWKIQKPDSAVIILKMLGIDSKKTLKYCEKKIFYPMLEQTCQYMQKMIKETRNESFTSNYRVMSQRTMYWSLEPSKENFSCLISDPSRFTAKETSTLNSNQRKSIHPYFSDAIVKSELREGKNNLIIRRIMINLLKKHDFWAQVFDDEDHISVFF